MAYNASHGRLSPPAPHAVHRPGKRPRSPPAAMCCPSSGYVTPFYERRRWQNPAGAPRWQNPAGAPRWENPAGAPRHAWQEYRVPPRRWMVADEVSTSGRDACTIMSYNILADTHARNHLSELYWDVPGDAMRWDSRRRLILREIRHWDSDLVCLQEVDRFREIAPEMKDRGYECSFKERPCDARDGCATFWKSERLRLLEEDSIDFSEFNMWNNVAQVLVFELNGNQKFVLGNIHVLFSPKRGDIKLGQVRMLLDKAYALAEKWEGIPIVLAGDFNCTPDSAIYEFLSTMQLNISLHDRGQMSGTLDSSEFDLHEPHNNQWSAAQVRNATGYSNDMVARHPLKLSSSYAMLKGNSSNRGHDGEPLATSFHNKFLGTVDYFWYTRGLECSRVLDTLPLDDLKRTRGLPTREMGSDHIPIVAEFVFTSPTQDDSEQKDDTKQEDDSEQEDDTEQEDDSEQEDESEPDDESAQEATRTKRIYFSDSDS